MDFCDIKEVLQNNSKVMNETIREKMCPILTAVRKEGIQGCFKESCAWWDTHYNCCAILSSAVLLEILSKSKKEAQSKTQNE